MIWSDVKEVAIHIASYGVHCTGQRQTNIIAVVEQLMKWNVSGGSSDQILEMITSGQ